jgi:hypothetical protein
MSKVCNECSQELPTKLFSKCSSNKDGLQGKCKLCDKKIGLELHHINYQYLGKELLNMEWIVILCSQHHQEVHNLSSHIWNPKNFNKKRNHDNG